MKVDKTQNKIDVKSSLIEDEGQYQKSTHICRVFKNIRNNDKQ